jgi:hypothetical protein
VEIDSGRAKDQWVRWSGGKLVTPGGGTLIALTGGFHVGGWTGMVSLRVVPLGGASSRFASRLTAAS